MYMDRRVARHHVASAQMIWCIAFLVTAVAGEQAKTKQHSNEHTGQKRHTEDTGRRNIEVTSHEAAFISMSNSPKREHRAAVATEVNSQEHVGRGPHDATSGSRGGEQQHRRRGASLERLQALKEARAQEEDLADTIIDAAAGAGAISSITPGSVVSSLRQEGKRVLVAQRQVLEMEEAAAAAATATAAAAARGSEDLAPGHSREEASPEASFTAIDGHGRREAEQVQEVRSKARGHAADASAAADVEAAIPMEDYVGDAEVEQGEVSEDPSLLNGNDVAQAAAHVGSHVSPSGIIEPQFDPLGSPMHDEEPDGDTRYRGPRKGKLSQADEATAKAYTSMTILLMLVALIFVMMEDDYYYDEDLSEILQEQRYREQHNRGFSSNVA